MSVEFIPAARVRDLVERLQAARQRAVDQCGPPAAGAASAEYWELLFERNAAEVMATVPAVTLPAGFVVRYRFFGMRERDLLVRPFVARAATDVDTVRRLLDWHAPPDSQPAGAAAGYAGDVELLYRHFEFPRTALGYFEYWLVLQELWASQRWAHAHLIASASELSQITGGPGWEVIEPVQVYEPAVVLAGADARLAVLVESPLERFAIHLEQIDIGLDQSIRYAPRVLVASGPKGYFV